GPADTKAAQAALGPTEAAIEILSRGEDAQFIPDRAGLYRFKRAGLTQLIAVNAPAASVDAMAPPDFARSGLTGRLPLRWWLLAAMLALLIAEAWLAGRGPERFLRRAALMRGNPLA